MENLFLTVNYIMETNNLNKKFCEECGEEITTKEYCIRHKKDGVRIYRHNNCKENNEIRSSE